MMAVICNLRELANRHGYKLNELAKILNVSRDTVYAWSNNRCKPTRELTLRLLNLLNCTYQDLYTLGTPELTRKQKYALEKEKHDAAL